MRIIVNYCLQESKAETLSMGPWLVGLHCPMIRSSCASFRRRRIHLHRPCRVFKDLENNPEGFCLNRRDHIESPTSLNRLCRDERIIRCPNKKTSGDIRPVCFHSTY